MRSASRLRLSALHDGMRVLMPGAVDTELLRACLWTGEPARQAWDRFQQQAGDLRELFRTDLGSRKRFGPLLAASLRRNAVSADASILTVLRTALLREELRASLYGDILVEVLQVLDAGDARVVVLKGAAFGVALYDQPAHRHSHDIDLLVRAEDAEGAARALEAHGFRVAGTGPHAGGGDLTLIHRRALPVNLHSTLLPVSLPGRTFSFAELWSRTREARFSGHPARMLSPADSLVQVLGQATLFPARGSLQWAADAWLLIDRSADLDWELLIEWAGKSRVTLSCWTRLEYLAEELHAGVPAGARTALAARAAATEALERDLALYAARAGSGLGAIGQVLSGSTAAARARLLAWLLLPSRAYMGSTFGARSGLGLPAAYVRRALRYGIAELGSRRTR